MIILRVTHILFLRYLLPSLSSHLHLHYIVFKVHFYLQSLLFLSLVPEVLVGSNGIEPSTSRLSGVRSNHLSYEPTLPDLLGSGN